MKLLKSLGPLLLGAAWAVQGPSIEDMLADDQTGPSGSSGNTAPASGIPAPGSGSGGGAPVGGGGGIGQMLGKITSAVGQGQQQQSAQPKGKDMFGRLPSRPVNPLAALFNGGGGGGAGPGPGGAPAPAAGGGGLQDALLNSIEQRMPVNGKMAAKMGIKQPISQESQMIVSGIVEEFMHKYALSPDEKQCLERNIAHLTGDVVGASQDAVNAIKAVIAGRPGAPNGSPQLSAKSQGAMVSAGLDGGMKITSLITETTSLARNCVKGDALAMLRETGQNMINVKYVSHRLLVSGVDIASRISDGIIAYENKDWHRFGQDIGIAIRKVFLSNSTRGSRLPEGVPEEKIIQETVEGLMAGFFARGTGVEITDRAAPDVDIQLDLHRCIASNHEFFKEIWLALWNLIAELAVDAGKHQFNNPFAQGSGQGEQPKWMGEIMVAMMQVPMALSNCNIDQESQQMMMQAIKSIQYLKVHFLFPGQAGVMDSDKATMMMSQAINAWTNWNFKGFGKQIGRLLRAFVLLMYPQQYYVDPTGRLRRQLSGKSCEDGKTCLKVGGLTLSASFMAFVVGGVAMTMLVALVAVRGLRSMNRNNYQDSSATRTDGADLEKFIEVECVE